MISNKFHLMKMLEQPFFVSTAKAYGVVNASWRNEYLEGFAGSIHQWIKLFFPDGALNEFPE